MTKGDAERAASKGAVASEAWYACERAGHTAADDATRWLVGRPEVLRGGSLEVQSLCGVLGEAFQALVHRR